MGHNQPSRVGEHDNKHYSGHVWDVQQGIRVLTCRKVAYLRINHLLLWVKHLTAIHGNESASQWIFWYSNHQRSVSNDNLIVNPVQARSWELTVSQGIFEMQQLISMNSVGTWIQRFFPLFCGSSINHQQFYHIIKRLWCPATMALLTSCYWIELVYSPWLLVM